jgi:Zn2+/Cd2+-exporting ATPase
MAVQTKQLSIPLLLPNEGDCESCVNRLKNSLLHTRGVLSAEIDTDAARLILSYDPAILSLERLEARAQEAGIEVAQQFSHEALRLADLDCPDCARTLESGIARLPGVVWVAVSVPSSRMVVEYDAATLAPGRISQQVFALGYRVVGTGPVEAKGFLWQLLHNHRFLVTLSCAALTATGWFTSSLAKPVGHNLSFGLYLAAVAVGGFPIFRGALGSLRARTLDMNALMTIATIGAICIGHSAEAAEVVLLFAVGNFLESYTMDRTRQALEMLMKLAPERARVKRGEGEELLPTERVTIGDIVIIRPGERIPLDGEVVKGASSLDESMITGESLPVQKTTGDMAWAGSINEYGALEVRVDRVASESTLARILALIEAAQTQKTPAQRIIDRFARYYTPTVILAAVGLATIPPLLFNQPAQMWVYRSLTLLVVACPCALVIATPVAIVAALSAAAREGVLVKGGSFLEQAAGLRAIALDKTGTLTAGKAFVTDVIGLGGHSDDDVLIHAAAVESRSEHHLALAIRAAAKDRSLRPAEASDFVALPGIGASARVDSMIYKVGNARLIDAGTTAGAEVARLSSAGKTVVVVWAGNEPIGLIALADQPRMEAIEVVSRLREMGIDRLAMLTGDNEQTAQAVANSVGITEWKAQLLPHQKVAEVKALIEKWGQVAMVGDGINDAPALAAASVGIAMGSSGTDIALETADVVLMGDDLTKLPYLVGLGRRAVAVMKQNILFAVLIKTAFVLLAFSGWLTLWLAVVGDTGVSLLVMLNGMRLLGRRKHPASCKI